MTNDAVSSSNLRTAAAAAKSLQSCPTLCDPPQPTFHLAYSFLCCVKAFKFNQVPPVDFVFISITLGDGS